MIWNVPFYISHLTYSYTIVHQTCRCFSALAPADTYTHMRPHVRTQPYVKAHIHGGLRPDVPTRTAESSFPIQSPQTRRLTMAVSRSLPPISISHHVSAVPLCLSVSLCHIVHSSCAIVNTEGKTIGKKAIYTTSSCLPFRQRIESIYSWKRNDQLQLQYYSVYFSIEKVRRPARAVKTLFESWSVIFAVMMEICTREKQTWSRAFQCNALK